MNTRIERGLKRILLCLTALFLFSNVICAQEAQEAKGLCFPKGSNTSVVQGFIGGEAHDSYVFHAKSGRKITLKLTSRGNRAGFSVSTTEFGDPVDFGQEATNGKGWSGTIPQTGVYFISVTAHPQARYTLRVTME